MYDMESFKNECYTFNTIAGKDKDMTLNDLTQQFKLIQEEVEEIGEGLVYNNPVEVLDGVIDTLVVTLGMLQKLENLGFDVKKAMKDTAENNLSKFIKGDSGGSTVDDILKVFNSQGIAVKAEYNIDFDVWSFKDKNNKVRKPFTFKPNDLTDCVPCNILKLGFVDK